MTSGGADAQGVAGWRAHEVDGVAGGGAEVAGAHAGVRDVGGGVAFEVAHFDAPHHAFAAMWVQPRPAQASAGAPPLRVSVEARPG